MENDKRYVYRIWDEKTQNSGIESIDKHHKNFVDVINLLVDVLNGDLAKEKMHDIFHKLFFYAEIYLIEEELLFKQNNFPDFQKHKEIHQDFVNQITLLQQKFAQQDSDVCINLMKFLDRWFKNHILKEDVEAVKHILQH